jgi:hypothetical protein
MQMEISASPPVREHARRIMRDLRDSGERGIISDFPKLFRAECLEATGGLPTAERSNKGVTPVRATKTQERTFQPFQDAFGFCRKLCGYGTVLPP